MTPPAPKINDCGCDMLPTHRKEDHDILAGGVAPLPTPQEKKAFALHILKIVLKEMQKDTSLLQTKEERFAYLEKVILVTLTITKKETLAWVKEGKDSIFIRHIESHSEVQNAPYYSGKAICKICGKTAEDIIANETNDRETLE